MLTDGPIDEKPIDINNLSIEINIEYIIGNNEYYLYFMNNNVIIGDNQIKKEFINGKMKLDFVNYDYLFSITSKTCGCKDENINGFQYQVSISTVKE